MQTLGEILWFERILQNPQDFRVFPPQPLPMIQNYKNPNKTYAQINDYYNFKPYPSLIS